MTNQPTDRPANDQLVIGENDSETEETATFLERAVEALDNYGEEAVAAFYKNQPTYWDSEDDVDDFADQFRDAYQGTWSSDEDFAEDFAEDTGALNGPEFSRLGVSWPYTCIDWTRAARELMYDYFEIDGYYFRNV